MAWRVGMRVQCIKDGRCVPGCECGDEPVFQRTYTVTGLGPVTACPHPGSPIQGEDCPGLFIDGTSERAQAAARRYGGYCPCVFRILVEDPDMEVHEAENPYTCDPIPAGGLR